MGAKTEIGKPAGYRVRFYRTIVNGTGMAFHCTVDSIDIRNARSPDRALDAAKRRFERKHRLAAWDHLAHGCASEEMGEDGPARGAA